MIFVKIAVVVIYLGQVPAEVIMGWAGERSP